MKQWYVLLEDLTDEQEAELSELVIDKSYGHAFKFSDENCIGCLRAKGEPYNYVLDLCWFWDNEFDPQDQITFEEAKKLLSSDQ